MRLAVRASERPSRKTFGGGGNLQVAASRRDVSGGNFAMLVVAILRAVGHCSSFCSELGVSASGG